MKQTEIAEALVQKEIMEQLKIKLADKQLNYLVQTFGCQMNAHDSEKLKGVLETIGYKPVDKEEEADFIIYNTCSVRENAEQRVFGRLGHLKHLKQKNPNLLIGLCGCMMQQDHIIDTLKKSYRHVDIVFGTHNLYKMAELIQTRLETGSMVIDIWDSHKDIVEDLPTIRRDFFRSSVNIMYGCNNFCTYCIVPYVRGRERSREVLDILNEVRELAKDGVIEITLLGQNVNSYGQNLEIPTTFAKLLREISQIEGIERIRFMTPHPKDLSDELIDVISESPKICNHIHLPFQSGSTKVLTAMNRRYTKESYLALVERIKAKIPGAGFTSDIIVGFPGETEEDFLETLDVVRKVEFINAYTYIYSKRSGTQAAKMDDQVPEEVISERFNRLLVVQKEISYKLNAALVGTRGVVLVEEVNHQKPEMVSGRLETGNLVHFIGGKELIGQLVNVNITFAKSFYLIGERVE